MISFYPGPSKIYPEVAVYMQHALKGGVLSMNHRSKEFVAISRNTISLLKKKLNIPQEYSVFFTSSATECWEIITQSLIQHKSFHIYNGAFGEKWFQYTKHLRPSAESFPFDIEKKINSAEIDIPSGTEVICMVQNETSNGTQIDNTIIAELRKKNSDKLIAVDATSSMAGVKLEIKNADIWLASVQKCFGLPAGLGLFICSPAAITRAEKLRENLHYNSLPFMIEKMKDWQTTYTPNVLGIYLLLQVMQKAEGIRSIDTLIRKRYESWYSFLKEFKEIEPLIGNKDCRSYTVITLKGDPDKIKKIKEKAKKEGILLGNGYGHWAKNTFRIANFPAMTEKEIALLKKFLKKNVR